MRGMLIMGLGLAAIVLSGCPAAAVDPERLRISAQDASVQAHTRAVTWSPDAALRWIEVDGLAPDGFVYPGDGEWRLVYDAPDREQQLEVAVTTLTLSQSTRAPRSPAGFVIGDAALAPGWVDSPRAMEAALAAGAADFITGRSPRIGALLLPLQTPEWRIRVTADAETREWRVHAGSGAVIP